MKKRVAEHSLLHKERGTKRAGVSRIARTYKNSAKASRLGVVFPGHGGNLSKDAQRGEVSETTTSVRDSNRNPGVPISETI